MPSPRGKTELCRRGTGGGKRNPLPTPFFAFVRIFAVVGASFQRTTPADAVGLANPARFAIVRVFKASVADYFF